MLPARIDDERMLEIVETAGDGETAAELLPVLPEPESKPSLRERLPRFSDATQRKAGRNLLWFLILVLVFTFIARGTSGAALALVDTSRPAKGEIAQTVDGTGTVKAGGGTDIEVPDGLTVNELLVAPGQKVAAGDPLAAFDPDEVQEQWQRQNTALEELRLKLSKLLRADPHDSSSLDSARRNAERAQQDYDAGRVSGENTVAAARAALETARAEEQRAREAMNAIADQTTQEYQDARAYWEACAADIPLKESALSQAETQASDDMQRLARALEDARAQLASAEKSDAQARQQANDAATQNNLEASTLRLDIEAQQKKVDALKALGENGGILAAPGAGMVQSLPEEGSKTGQGGGFSMEDTSGGYRAELWLNKADAEQLAPGDVCDVALSGGSMYYRPTAEGKVLSVGAAGEDGRCKVVVQLPGEDWKSGQTVDIQMVKDRQNHNFCLPLSALHADSEGYYVLVLREESTVLGTQWVAVKVPVTVKAQNNTTAAVEGALGDRDEVITGSSKGVEPGDAVRVNA